MNICRIKSLFLLLFSTSMSLVIASDIDLFVDKNSRNNKPYSDIILTLRFVVPENIDMIFPSVMTMLDIKALYADDILLKPHLGGWYPFDRDVPKSVVSGSVIEMRDRIDYYNHLSMYGWNLLPGNSWKTLGYNIPSNTKQLRIVFRILFPGGKYSDEVISIIEL